MEPCKGYLQLRSYPRVGIETNGLAIYHKAAEELIETGRLLNDLIVDFGLIDTAIGEAVG